jgi:hypothetical protein
VKKLTLEVPHHLSKLHDELLTIPSIQPVDGRAVMTVSGDGQKLTLQVPDTADEGAIRQAVSSHDPTPPPPPPDPDAELAAAIAAVDTTGIVDPAAKAAVEALKGALLGKVRAGRVAAQPT